MQNEMVPLAERSRYMQFFRVACVALIIGARLVSPEIAAAPLRPALTAMAAYLLATGLGEALWRSWRGRGLPLFGVMLLVDGAFLAYLAYLTGGNLSPVRYLVIVHLIVVTLLASHRTGLKLALWHSLLLFVVFHAQEAGILGPLQAAAQTLPGSDYHRLSTFVVAFWMVALSTAAFSAINERELRRRRLDLEALAHMADALEKVHNPRDVADVLAEKLTESFGFRRLVVLGEPKGDPTVLAHRGPAPKTTVKKGVDDVVRKSWEQRQTLLLKRIDPRANPRLAKLLPDAENLVITPLLAEDRPIGIVAAEQSERQGTRIEQRIVAMVSQFSSHAALALDNAWLLERVQELAETDGLTGLANRRTFEAALELEVTRAFRNGDEVSLVMVDIDHFKQLNDTYGHQTGDDVLREVAAALGGECRDIDVVARYGGEEFVVILPSCSDAEALETAERLRRVVAGSETVVPVSISAGVATYPVNATDPTGLLQAADEALYESKRTGRNKVTPSRRGVAQGIPESPDGAPVAVGGTTA